MTKSLHRVVNRRLEAALLSSMQGENVACERRAVTIELSLAALAFVALVCLLAGFAHGALGFGFPIVATPLVALVIDIKSAIALLAPVTLVLVVVSMLRGGPLAPIARRFGYLPVALAAGAYAGTRFLMAAPPEPFLLLLAGVLVLYLNLDRLDRGRSRT